MRTKGHTWHHWELKRECRGCHHHVRFQIYCTRKSWSIGPSPTQPFQTGRRRCFMNASSYSDCTMISISIYDAPKGWFTCWWNDFENWATLVTTWPSPDPEKGAATAADCSWGHPKKWSSEKSCLFFSSISSNQLDFNRLQSACWYILVQWELAESRGSGPE